MPIISKIGQKTWRVRIAVYSIYGILLFGSLSMLYPLTLMLSGSVKSNADFQSLSPVPKFFFNDDVLWAKYIESKYNNIREIEMAMHTPMGNWSQVRRPKINQSQNIRAQKFIAFREQTSWSNDWFTLAHMTLGQNERVYLNEIKNRYDHDITQYSDALGVRYKSWSQAVAPTTPMHARYFIFPKTINFQILDEIKQSSLGKDRAAVNLDAIYWQVYLRPKWNTIKSYNEAHGTDYQNYQQVLLTQTAPESGPARDDWEDYVRHDLNLAYIRLDKSVLTNFRTFLANQYENNIDDLNLLWITSYSDFTQIPLMERIEGTSRVYLDYAEFLAKNTEGNTEKSIDEKPDHCPLSAISVYGIRQAFEEYIAHSEGIPVDQIEHLSLPIAAVDYADFQTQTGFLRWEFTKRNYIKVLDYILLHGNGIRNTIYYCVLTILTTLTINPLAAYALSRYKPPSAYKILLFCMCTMAFPPEVTMIPSFLLLKRFPLIGMLVAVLAAVLAMWAIGKVRPQLNDAFKGILAGIIGLVAGFYLMPAIFGADTAHVSLLNTFWALILPGAANGFGIFLLKGFFDSLPQELYEAAEIDGGGEFTKFWTITMSLSKPILAVLALSAFTAAYSEFMMALVIIPDPEMWTLMVWLFQLQSQAPPYVVTASIVIASIPTFLVFLFCQNLIMRGIVVPVEK